MESEEPLFRYESGTPITREEVQKLLQLAAIADGQPASRYGSHSLRIGGATAIYMTSQDLEHVKRFGRWSSSSFHNYLWESHGKQKGLAKGMASADGQLLPPRQLRAQREERVGCRREEVDEPEFHRSAKGGHLNSGGGTGATEDRGTEHARARSEEIQKGEESEGFPHHNGKYKRYGEIVEGYYAKQQQQHEQQHVVSQLPKIYGQRGSIDQSLDPFRHSKSACVWYQVET